MATTDQANDETFEAIIEASRLQDTLDAVGVLVDEMRLHVEPEGIEIRAVDPANVAMIDLELAVQAFESYVGTGRTLGVNVERLQEFLGMADSDDLVKLEFDSDARRLNLEIDGLDATFALIDPDSIRQEPDIPELDLPVRATIEGRDLSRGVTAASMIDDHIELGADPEADLIYVNAQGDTDDIHLELDSDDYISLDASEDASSLFGLDYVTDIEGPIPADAEVTLNLGSEFPVKIDVQIADGHASVLYMIAPRVQND